MQPNDINIRLESQQNQLKWRGTLIGFARANSLTAAQILELQGQLEQAGTAILSAFGAERYILRKA